VSSDVVANRRACGRVANDYRSQVVADCFDFAAADLPRSDQRHLRFYYSREKGITAFYTVADLKDLVRIGVDERNAG
jgi:hypothetical protein